MKKPLLKLPTQLNRPAMLQKLLLNKLLTVPLRTVLDLPIEPFIMDLPLDPLLATPAKSTPAAPRVPISPQWGVDSVEAIDLGGWTQWISLRGHDATRPLLVFFHGGPGLPLMPFQHINAGLENHFIVVHWDQRGAGKSYQPGNPTSLVTVEQLVEDARQLLEVLRARFPKRPLYLAGFSCGSVVGLRTVARYPHLVDAYVGIGQIAKMAESEAISYHYILERALAAGNEQAIQELKRLGPPPYKNHRAMLVQRKWVNKFGGFFAPQGEMDNVQFYLSAYQSPCYSMTDIAKLFKGLDFTAKALWYAFYQTDFFEEISRIEVPVLFLEGRHDYVVPSAVAERFCNQLDAPAGKQLVWFENSAHWPFLEEPDRFEQVLRQHLQP